MHSSYRKGWKGPSAVASLSNGRISKYSWDAKSNIKHTRIRSPNFSIFIQAWKGSCSSLPLMTIFGKSSKWTSRGSRGALNNYSFKRISKLTQHSFPSDNDLFWLLLDRKRTNESGNFLSSFPLGQLSKPFLSSPNAGVDNLQEQLPWSGVENENGTICGTMKWS